MSKWLLEAVDYQSNNAAEEFTNFIKNTGFGIIKNHPVDPQLIADVYKEWEAFFHDESRFDYMFDPETQEGYIPFEQSEIAKGCELKDLKEFYHLFSWGRYPSMLSNKTKALWKQLNEIAETLLDWIEANTPKEVSKNFSMPLRKMIEDSPNTIFRVLYYPALTGKEAPGAERAAAHGDINMITILPAASSEGLQVMGPDDQWHPIPVDPSYLIVNTGDMLDECSGGYYKSTLHRVVNPEGEKAKEARLSLPLFLHAHRHVKLSDRHTVESYLKERYGEIGF